MGPKILFIFILFFVNDKENDIQTIRKMFTEAVEKKEKAEHLISVLSSKPKTPLINGYLGAVNMVMAKHAINPFSKLSFFNTGKGYLDSSIKQNNSDPELRLLRYTIQVSAPSFLSYNSEISADRAFLMNSLNSEKIEDKQLQLAIANFLKLQKCTPTEKKMISKYL